MTFDLNAWLAGTQRELKGAPRVNAVVVSRRYEAPIERVWKAWTEGWRSKIVQGEAKPGETVVLDLGVPKHITSKILACDAPNLLTATWQYGDTAANPPDEVSSRLKRDGDGTILELEHRSETGPAGWAAGVGAGWESGLMTFDYDLRGEPQSNIPMDTAFPALDAFWTDLEKKR